MDEYQIKAVFLYNFSRVIIWPPDAFADYDTPFIICVLGEDPFGSFFDIVNDSRTRGRPLATRRIVEAEETLSCHILFISVSEQAYLSEWLHFLKDQPILTVSDIANFAVQGGMIELYTKRRRIRMRMNLAVLRQAGLEVMASLLALVQVVSSSGPVADTGGNDNETEQDTSRRQTAVLTPDDGNIPDRSPVLPADKRPAPPAMPDNTPEHQSSGKISPASVGTARQTAKQPPAIRQETAEIREPDATGAQAVGNKKKMAPAVIIFLALLITVLVLFFIMISSAYIRNVLLRGIPKK
ncbi:MAG: YfiR family protein [Gammaproteobacteria bacterium]|nr:YfiR family protein [Gammaproteobacteria bacterium]